MAQVEYCEIEVEEVLRENDTGFLFLMDEGEYEVWINKDDIENPDDIQVGEEDIAVNVVEEVLRKKGLLE